MDPLHRKRRQLPALCDKRAAAKDRLLAAWRPGRRCAAFRLDNAGPGSRWAELMLLYNADAHPHAAILPEGRWQLLADGENSFAWQAMPPRTLTAQAVLPAGAALVLGRTE